MRTTNTDVKPSACWAQSTISNHAHVYFNGDDESACGKTSAALSYLPLPGLAPPPNACVSCSVQWHSNFDRATVLKSQRPRTLVRNFSTP